MISVEKGKISIKGSGQELLQDTLSIVYSIRKSMIQSKRIEFVELLDRNLLSILAETFDDNVVTFKKFDKEADYARFAEEHEAHKKNSTAENIMRDIWKD